MSKLFLTFEKCTVGVTPNMPSKHYGVDCSRSKKLYTINFYLEFYLSFPSKEDNPILKNLRIEIKYYQLEIKPSTGVLCALRSLNDVSQCAIPPQAL